MDNNQKIIKKGFTAISIGLLVVMLDLRINGWFDIFLNPIGFALMAYGTYQLSRIENPMVIKYSMINILIFGILFIFSIPLMFYPSFIGTGFNMEIKEGTDLIAGIIYLILQFAGIALICFSVRELSSGKLKSRANLMGKLSFSVPLVFFSYISVISLFPKIITALLAVPIVIFILCTGLGAIIISWKARYLNIEPAEYT